MGRTIAFAILTFVLSACGGGGSGADLAVVPPPAPPGGVANFVPAVAYLADADVDERRELFTASLDGAQFLKVSGPLGAGGNVSAFAWSPDRTRLAYVARASSGAAAELFVVMPTGGAALQVSNVLTPGDECFDFHWAPSSARLAFRVLRIGLPTTMELWSVAPDGTGLTNLVPALSPGDAVMSYDWAPDSTRVAYVVQGATVARLFTVPGAGGPGAEVSADLPASDSVRFTNRLTPATAPPFAWSSTSQRLAFVGEHPELGIVDLYVAAPDGTSFQPLYQNATAPDRVESFAWAPDASRIAFSAGNATRDTVFLRTDLVGGGDLQEFSSTDFGAPQAVSYAWAPDSATIALAGYFATGLSGGPSSVFLVPPAGGPLTFFGPFFGTPSFPEPLRLTWSPDGTRLAVLGPSSYRHLYAAPMSAPVAQLLELTRTGVIDFAFSPDGESIAFTGDIVSEFVFDAVVTDADTRYDSHLVSPMLGVAAGAGQIGWSSGGTRVLFTLDLDGYAVRHLYAVAADGTGLVQLSGPLTPGGQVIDYAVR